MTVLLPTLDVIAGLNPEEEQPEEGRLKAVGTPELEEIVRIARGLLEEDIEFEDDTYNTYKKVYGITPEGISAAQITEATILMAQHHHKNTLGFYISSLINKSRDVEHLIHTMHFTYPIPFLGVLLEEHKSLTIRGTAGVYLAEKSAGRIIVYGLVTDNAGYTQLPSGILTIHGNVGCGFGDKNRGKIVMEGCSGEWFGSDNQGIIQINGTYKSLASDLGKGDIYHNGVLIVEKGRRLV